MRKKNRIEKKLLCRIGNFEITHDRGPEHDYIRIKAIEGHWMLSYRDDTVQYGAWMQMAGSDDMRKSAEVLLAMYYNMTNVFVDKDFCDDFIDALDRLQQRRVESSPEPSEEDEDSALAETELLENTVID